MSTWDRNFSTDAVEVLDVPDLDADSGTDESFAEPPTGEVRWADGRTDVLPQTCIDADIGGDAVLEGHRLIHLGWDNLDGGMTSGYVSADLGQLGADVFFSDLGDYGGGEDAMHYLRGEPPQVITHWVTTMMPYYVGDLPWGAIIHRSAPPGAAASASARASARCRSR